MKKFYTVLITGCAPIMLSAQISLTSASHQLTVGELYSGKLLDSTTTVIYNTGANQSWDFSSCFANPSATAATPIVVSDATLIGNAPAGSTYSLLYGTEQWFFKNNANTVEITGMYAPQAEFNFEAEPLTYRNWSVDYQDVVVDYTNAGTYTSSTPNIPPSGTANGNITSNVSGYGSMVTPDGQSFANVLQVADTIGMGFTFQNGSYNVSIGYNSMIFNYYVPSQKLPVMQVREQLLIQMVTSGMNVISYQTQRSRNANYITAESGASTLENSLDLVRLFPNPSTNDFFIQSDEAIHVAILSTEGKVMMEKDITGVSAMNVSDLATGTYLVQLTDDFGTVRMERLIKQ